VIIVQKILIFVLVIIDLVKLDQVNQELKIILFYIWNNVKASSLNLSLFSTLLNCMLLICHPTIKESLFNCHPTIKETIKESLFN